ncbi:MAG TPA: hypothetical protein VMH23_04735, partial [Bacteroidota bacterium]|nr:hypothetical protein [Bacteroidota bacterium]
ERLQELEKQREELEIRLLSVETQKSADTEFRDSARAVASFILGFEESFRNATLFNKKALLKKVISNVVVDRKQSLIHLSTRLIPPVTPTLEYLLKKETAATKVVTAGCSGGRT